MPVALVFPLLLYAYDVKDKDDLQPTDSLLHDTGASQLSVKQLIVPASLVAYGIFEAAMMHGNRMLNYSIGHEVITHKPAKFRIDDYTQYVPAASVYVLNLAGGKRTARLQGQDCHIGYGEPVYRSDSQRAEIHGARATP